MKQLISGMLWAGVMLAAVAPAGATPILPNCGTCGAHNTSWELTLELINDAENIYRLTATATYATPKDFVYVNDVAFKVDAFVNRYDSTPTVIGPAESGWSILAGGISADGCSGAGNGFYCAQSSGNGAFMGSTGTVDTWVFLLNIDNSLANVVSTGGSFKAQFTNADSNKIGSLLSESVSFELTPSPPTSTSTPEPATLLLFGTGLAAAATAMRRHKKRARAKIARAALKESGLSS
jgi:hypothetical protein